MSKRVLTARTLTTESGAPVADNQNSASAGVGGPLLPALAGLAVVILCTEAFARGHLLQFIAGLLAVAVAAAAIWLITLAAIGHWRVAAAVLFVLAALALLLVNVRDFFSKR